MFQKGEYVIYGNNGICLIQDITTLNIAGVNKDRQYYLLKPVYASGSTVYTPVDTAETALRHALSKDEADSLIRSIPDIPLIPLTDEKTLEKTYKEYMRSNNCKAWVQLIKTIYLRKERRLMKGYKVTALDNRYFNRDEVKSYISSCIDEKNAKE